VTAFETSVQTVFGNIVSAYVVLGQSDELMEGSVLVLMAFNPLPRDGEGAFLDLGLDITKQVKVSVTSSEGP
jgi:hypothetical protein